MTKDEIKREIAFLSKQEREMLSVELFSAKVEVNHNYIGKYKIKKGFFMGYPPMLRLYENFGSTGAKIINRFINEADKKQSFVVRLVQSKDFGKTHETVVSTTIKKLIELEFIKKTEFKSEYIINPEFFIPNRSASDYEEALELWKKL